MLEAIPPQALPAVWGWLSARCRLPNLRERLETGAAVAFRIGDTDAAIITAIDLTLDSGVLAFWVESLGGNVGNKPHRNKALIGSVLDECEAIARRFGCQEMRIEIGSRSGWKKRLLPVLGFTCRELPTGPCMVRMISYG